MVQGKCLTYQYTDSDQGQLLLFKENTVTQLFLNHTYTQYIMILVVEVLKITVVTI